MRTDKQINASRTTDRKSSGPVTPEGKAKSAQNAVSHNLCTGQLVCYPTKTRAPSSTMKNHYIDRSNRWTALNATWSTK
jgi:hypothetical protein